MFKLRNLLIASGALLVLKTLSVFYQWPRLGGAAETLIGILVVVAFVRTAYAANGFERQYWAVLSTAFVAWVTAHLSVIYHRDLLGANIGPDYWAVIILYFVFAIPFAAVLFLEEEPTHFTFHWQEVLDLLQLGILVIALFLAFAYVPFLHSSSQQSIVEKSLTWHLIRNGVLILAFAIRAMNARTALVRYLFRRTTVYLLFYGAGAAAYYYAQGHWSGLALRLSDVLSDLVRVAAIVLVVTSRPPVKTEAPMESDVAGSGPLWVQIVLFPALVLYMTPRIEAENVFVAVMLVTASVACVCVRLYVTQRGARKSAELLRISERRFRILAQGISVGSGDALFKSLVLHAAEATGATYALIGELESRDPQTIRTLAVCKGNEILANFNYALAGTPCQQVIGATLCHFPDGVARHFPEDKLLADMNISAYVGAPLMRTNGEPLGIFVLLNEKPLSDPALAKSVLQICSARAARELERERDAESLRDTEHKLAIAFQLSPSPMLFGSWGKFDTVVDGQPTVANLKLISFSESLISFYGVSREEMVGRAPRELGSFMGANESGIDIVEIIERDKRFRDTELLIRNRQGDLRHVIGSGEIFEIGGEDYLLATFRDVTFERTAQRMLEASERKLRLLFENAEDFIFTCDFTGRFLTVNRIGRKLCGIHVEDVESHFLHEILDDESKRELKKHLEDVAQNLHCDVFEVELAEKGAVSMLEVSLQLISEDGEYGFVQGIARDITERKLLERKVVQSQRLEAVGTFAAGVAHDFNNLLTVIGGYADLAVAEADCSAKVKEEIGEIKQATRRAVALSNQLLAFSRKQVSQPKVMDLNESIKEMRGMLERLIREDIRFQTNLDPAGAIVFADPVQIDQIVMNLAANARDAMPKGGELRFSTSHMRVEKDDVRLNLKRGDYAVLTVSDTGTGMDEATVLRIFEPFFTTKEVGKGTGLGLATVYGIVQQMQGQISVTSGVGRGTTFTIYLPAARGRMMDGESKSTERDRRGTETILLVEDDAALRTLAQKVLDSSGYKVYSSPGAVAAEALLAEVGAQIQLMVTDVVMPDGGGVELANRIAKSYPHIKVLFISGYTAGQLPEGYLQTGRSAFLAKPFPPSELGKKVRELLDSKALVISGGTANTGQTSTSDSK